MTAFRYQCVNAGRRERGEINADTRESAIKLLKERGWTPTSVNEVAAKIDYSASGPGFAGVSVIRLAAYTRKFATLIKTDLPITEIFNILAEGEEGHLLPEASIHVANRIANGVKLGEAMAERPRVFSKLYIHMVEAGMNSGTLDLVAQNLAKLYESESALRKQLYGKLAYPIALLLFTFAISLIMKTIGFISNPVFMLLMTSWGIFAALVLLGRTAPGYKIYREIGFKIPGIGKMMRTINLARFCRVFGLQFAAGVPVLQGLDVAQEVLQDTSLENAVDRMKRHIVEGMNLRDSMVASGVFPTQMAGMVKAGEKAGGVEEMLNKLAEYYEQDIETMSSAMVTIIYFVVYMFVIATAIVILISAYGHYFGMIGAMIDEV